MLSNRNQTSLLKKALRLGIEGCILKDSALAEIVAGLRTVARGRPYFSPALMTEALLPHRNSNRMPDSSADLFIDLAQLTPTEKAILKFVGECRTTKEIAAQLFTSPRTVEKHRANICQKLELHGNHALTKFALAYRERL
ncbi:MAG: response regulator transcription factor [Blastocatellia bacterium]